MRTSNIARGVIPLLVTLFIACGSRDDPADASRQASSGEQAPALGGDSAAPAGTVYTADEGSNTLSAVDLPSGRVTPIPVAVVPHNVEASADGRLLLAIGPVAAAHGDHDDAPSDASGGMGGRVVILDPANLHAPAISVPVGRHPAHVIVDAAGALAYATNSEDNSLTVIDIAEQRAVATIPVCEFPHGLRMRPDGREIHVACVDGNSVGVVDVAAGRMVARVPVGKAPVQVGFTPDGRRVYVSLRDDNAVAVVDVANRRKVATIPVGRGPIQLAATPDGRFVYAANQGTEEQPDSTVSVIETATNRVTATIPTGAGAHGVAVSSDGHHVFIANSFANTMSVIEVRRQRVIRTVPVGRQPGGIACHPDTPDTISAPRTSPGRRQP